MPAFQPLPPRCSPSFPPRHVGCRVAPCALSRLPLPCAPGSPLLPGVQQRQAGIRKEYEALDTVWFMAGVWGWGGALGPGVGPRASG